MISNRETQHHIFLRKSESETVGVVSELGSFDKRKGNERSALSGHASECLVLRNPN